MAEATKKWSLGTFLLNVIATLIFFPALMLLLAGDWTWIEGWIFGLWMSAMILCNVGYMYFNNPELLAERSKRPGSDNQKGWDRYVQVAILFIAVLWLVILPLDARRFGWSPAFPLWLKLIGGPSLIPALYLIVRPAIENSFLSAAVRIQEERKQHVITTGVYSFVRHPLYLGCALMMFGAPLLLGSIYALVLSLVGFLVLVGRIVGEEKMLENELEGYREYQQKVKYRLIPFIW